MTAESLLIGVLQQGLQVWCESGQLCFRGPKGALAADRRIGLSAQKGALMGLIGPGQRIARVSLAQQRMWFLEKLQPYARTYIVPVGLWIDGPLDIDALRRALAEIVGRHEPLRTTFAEVDGVPVQVIHSSMALCFAVDDLAEVPLDRREQEALRRATADIRMPFDLERGPLFRCTLLRVLPERHLLAAAVHHIVSDGWSIGVWLKELAELYEAYRCGEEPHLPGLSKQYADLAQAQYEMLGGAGIQPHVEYWRETLRGSPPLLELPADRPRPPVQTYSGAHLPVEMPEQLTESLAQFGRGRGATLFMTLLAGFYALLHRHTRLEDIIVGCPIAGRTRREMRDAIGLFVNTLPMRTDLSGDPCFADLVNRVRTTVLGAIANQDVPFEQIVDAIETERDLSHSPLYQVMFVLQNSPLPSLTFSGLRLKPVDLDPAAAKFDLAVSLLPEEGRLTGWFEYNTDLFETSTIQRLARHYENLLRDALRDPAQPISRLTMLSEAERRQLLVEWNGAKDDTVRYACVHRLVEEAADRFPGRLALAGCRDDTLTFDELNRRANRLARFLLGFGAARGKVVAVCLERSPALVVAQLAILKAGAAFLPLDPVNPSERLAFMMRDADVPLLLTQESLLEVVPRDVSPIRCVDAEWADVARSKDDNLDVPVELGDLAYVIYTSGSTGLPKGVQIEHQGLANLIAWLERAYNVTEQDRATQLAGQGFDASVLEVWPFLTSGASVHFPDTETRALPSRLIAWMADRDITLAFLPTQLAEAALDERWPPGIALRAILTGGDKLHKRPNEAHPFILVNHYGPTENTVVSTWGRVSVQGSEGVAPHIGKPLPNTEVYLLDKHFQPVPIGVPGELYVGGVQLARGYLNRPDLDRASFIPHPFSAKMGARLYKTGDTARYLSDGNIEFLGRIDDQLKVRGFRIELGEVESVLKRQTGVREAVVLAREDMPGEKRLAGYVVPKERVRLDAALLRSALRQVLPDYMIPSAITVLDAFPLNASGKIDRRALPAPSFERNEGRGYVAPGNPTEQTLAKIWADVLRLDRVGVRDNFFELGGDSILSIQVIARANQAGLYITPKQIFEHQTVAELAAAAGMAKTDAGEQGFITGPIPLTPIQCWFFERDFVEPCHWNQAVLLDLRAPIPAGHLEEALDALVDHHDALRLRFERRSDGWAQTVAPPGCGAPLVYIDLSGRDGDARDARLEVQAAAIQSSLDLSAGPLVKAAYIDFGAERPPRFLMAIHHLAVDGVSWRVLLEDLERALEQRERGERIHFPPKTASYKRWAESLGAYARRLLKAGAQDYWLDPAWDNAPRLPVDHPNGANLEQRARTLTCTLGRDDTHALLHDVPPVYHTRVNEVLLTALVQAFEPWIGAGALLVDVEGHGREDVGEGLDLSRTVGWFTAMYPLLVSIENAEGPGGALKMVKEQVRAVPDRGVSYGVLRYLSGDPAAASCLRKAPQPEVSFNYLGQFDQLVGDASLLAFSDGPIGPMHSPRGQRPHEIDFNALVRNGELRIDWSYSGERYDTQTIKDLAARFLDALRSLIAHCLAAGGGGFTASDFPLARLAQAQLDRLLASIAEHAGSNAKIEDIYRLSPMQQGLLFHSLYTPQQDVYVEQFEATLDGRLDPGAFQAAWQAVVERHPILRTGFYWEGMDEPHQIVMNEAALDITFHDWRGNSLAERAERVEAFRLEDRRKGFDLRRPPLTRISVLRLDVDRHVLLWTTHHTIVDGWSMPIILGEVFACYETFAASGDMRLESARAYRDHIAWLERQDLGEAERFWRRKLAGFTEPTPLGLDRPSGSISEETRYAQREVHLLPRDAERLLHAARALQLTINALLQGAWALLLSRCSGHDDVVYGATVSGRPASLPGVESIVGLFINTLPVRIHVDEEASVAEWLATIQEDLVEVRQFEYSPLEQVQAWSDLPRDLPLFESLLVFENYPVDPALREGRGGLQISAVRDFGRTNYPLTLVASLGDTVMLRAMYDASRFDDDAVARLLSRLRNVLDQFAQDSGQKVSQVLALTEDERRLLAQWSMTRTSYPRDATIDRLFEVQVDRAPDAVALVLGENTLTYRELDRRANQLANRLRKLGVGPETMVGVCAERSFELIAGLLGILKAGGAYVPLDPDYPVERLAFMIEDTQAPVLLVQRGLEDSLPAHAATVLYLDAHWRSFAEEPDTAPGNDATAENLAYVMYTSGSTGRPKGVSVTHRGPVRLVQNTNFLRYNGEDVFLLLAPVSFDASTLEIWGPLLNGGRLAIMPAGTPSLEDLGNALRTYGVTTLWLTAGLFHLMVDERLEDLQQVKTVLAGGDVLSPAHVKRLLEAPGERTVINGYGPTENVTFTCCCPMTSTDQVGATVSIGRPIANTSVYILDSKMRPVPLGVPGELYTGGDGLARGYLNRPDLTAAAFMPDPFSAGSGARLYKTGDRVRYVSDGSIEFLGRIDQQVKIRGFRVEPGEIEAILVQHPAVREATVIAREDVPGEKQLAAYVVAEPGQTWTLAEMRAFLENKVPDYMVPSGLMTLDALPLDPNGKVDRKKLLAPRQAAVKGADLYVPPRTAVEKQVAAIWAEALHVERVSIRDHFLDLGGHSLLAIRLLSKINDAFGVNLPLKSVFEQPTVEGLASRIEEARAHAGRASDEKGWTVEAKAVSGLDPCVVPLATGGAQVPLFCVGPVGGVVFPYYALAHQMQGRRPVYGLQDPALVSGKKPYRTVEELAAHYAESVRSVFPTGPYCLAGWSFGGLVAYEIARVLRGQGAKVGLVGLIDTNTFTTGVHNGKTRTWRERWENAKKEARFVVSLVIPFFENVRDFFYLALRPNRSSVRDAQGVADRLRTVWADAIWRRFLREAAMAETVGDDEGVLPLDQPPSRRVIRVMWANMRTVRRYVPKPYDGAVTLFRAARQPESTAYQDPTLGWAPLVGDRLQVLTVPGDHVVLLRPPCVKEFAAAVEACLAAVEATE